MTHHLRVMQATFHVATNHAHAIVIAWWLKMKLLGQNIFLITMFSNTLSL
jgi:hypothetical protein